ncbi:formimidoylglutamase [Polaribacter sp. L3A8]|uniref:formimidoylglutamase n=1 Tax=Polaribacter sp. L3A8 TaxID=2686361 RepID=UPI00131E8939|nr:formimidoylglutamase [Polaribacter sp. L3A8]
MDKLNMTYQLPEKKFWTGRKSNPALENQYWYQEIELRNIKELDHKQIDIALIGYACDEGVKRNLGRIGASESPNVIRERLAKLPIHFEAKKIVDVGNITCINQDLETCQLSFAKAIKKLISNGIFPIAIGGGHDIAYGHFKGIYESINNKQKNKIAIINFDAHFDLRPVETKPNSGTPFNQILNEFKNVTYFPIGIQQQSNTKELFNIAKSKNVAFVINYDCETDSEKINAIKKKLQPIIEKSDYIYITIDMDGFSSAYAPGVSAPSSLGFTPNFVFKILHYLFETKKVISCDIAELNPSLDIDNTTANLAAKLINFIVMEQTKNSLLSV